MGKPLHSLDFVIVDCQTTGASPARGRIIELGWMIVRGAPTLVMKDCPVASERVSLPEDADVPLRVAKMTGICKDDLAEAPTEQQVWKSLVDDIKRKSAGPDVRFVAHYARFEKAFVEDLVARFGMDSLNWSFLCTHDLASRLYPDLPRLSLRALAGHLGYRLPELKRAPDHVLATAHVWSCLVNLLSGKMGIDDWESLQVFLTEPRPIKNPRKTYLLPKEKRKGLPTNPGVYRFIDQTGGLLYVGKAANLRSRVGSYFRSRPKQSEHILEMITQAYDLRFESMETRLEAAVAEADLIKKQDPPYNRALRNTDEDGLVFFSANFESMGDRFGQPHTAGPFPRNTSVKKFSLIAGLMDKITLAGGGGDFPLESVSIFGRHAVDGETLREGLGALKAAILGEGKVSPLRLLALGVIVAEYQRQKKKQKRQNVQEEKPVREIGEFTWTRERVSRGVLGLIGDMGGYWRRSVLLRFLSQSVIIWKTGEEKPTPDRKENEKWRFVEIVGTQLDGRGGCLGEPPALPLRCDGSDWNLRGRDFNQAGYDRLRVLETELRRLVGQGRSLRVLFVENGCWSGRRLKRLLGGS